MILLSLTALVLLSQFVGNAGQSCTAYDDSSSCDADTLCIWVDEGASSYCGCASVAVLDVLFVMDISGSVGSAAWVTEQAFVSDMITSGVDQDSSVAVMTFGSGAWSQWNFTDPQMPRSDITDVVNNLPYTGGSTYMRTAVTSGIAIFEQTGDPENGNLMILITDGNPYPSRTQTVCSSDIYKDALDDAGVTVVVVGVGDGWSENLIDCLVDDTESQIIQVDDFSDDDFDAVRQYTDSFLCPDVTLAPTEMPTDNPTQKPTDSPTDKPTENPTDKPSDSPTDKPTDKPTDSPTDKPTDKPTDSPTDKPTYNPTAKPTVSPTEKPTDKPTDSPSDIPTFTGTGIGGPGAPTAVPGCDTGVPECPTPCDTDPCECVYDQVKECIMNTCHPNGCDQCQNGYFKKDYNYPCVQCQATFGNDCMHCTDFLGCQQCHTGTRTYDPECGMFYCSDCA